ncbi:3-oxoacyl-ACP reductase FabG [Noviherbaspirillum aridicola]|uniref:3-ketoacyl-ACP reductase n=1 Tax=Noviherbaspirillum aridicola TaxID=2849687 RepID=A0ABQ4Q606_9BURK|nr:3-oxoacyl-ACP reductase FabG [Noviherbaspirillum aridicola]GIZ52558.1 3-ketoacyl-ACP reductase [Noviherbaspirillum aridicola]
MKHALVTGGSGVLGAAICHTLAADGHHVYVHANRRRDQAQAVVDSIRASGGQAEVLVFDVTDGARVSDVLAPLVDSQPIQILVNNAGIHDDAVFPGMRESQWQSVIDVSLNGFFHVTHALMMPMIRSRWGRVINMSSVAALAGNRGQVNYAAAKGALNAATKSLALEVASRGITVNAVAPGIIDSDMIEGAFDKQAIERMVPMKRAGQPQEVADLVGFLASTRAAYITGQIISINGGLV